MTEDEERHADEVNIAFQMGAEWERKRGTTAWRCIHEGAVLALQERIRHLEEINLKQSLIKADDMQRIIRLEDALREIAELGFWDGDRACLIAKAALKGDGKDG